MTKEPKNHPKTQTELTDEELDCVAGGAPMLSTLLLVLAPRTRILIPLTQGASRPPVQIQKQNFEVPWRHRI